MEIGTETPIFLFWEYLFRNFGILLQCRFDSPIGADPRDGGAGEGLHGEGHVWALPLGAHPPQVPGSKEDGEGLPSLQQVRQPLSPSCYFFGNNIQKKVQLKKNLQWNN